MVSFSFVSYLYRQNWGQRLCMIFLANTFLKVTALYVWCKCFYIDGLAQECSISTANALDILQSCTKPSIYNNSYRFKSRPMNFNLFLANTRAVADVRDCLQRVFQRTQSLWEYTGEWVSWKEEIILQRSGPACSFVYAHHKRQNLILSDKMFVAFIVSVWLSSKKLHIMYLSFYRYNQCSTSHRDISTTSFNFTMFFVRYIKCYEVFHQPSFSFSLSLSLYIYIYIYTMTLFTSVIIVSSLLGNVLSCHLFACVWI